MSARSRAYPIALRRRRSPCHAMPCHATAPGMTNGGGSLPKLAGVGKTKAVRPQMQVPCQKSKSPIESTRDPCANRVCSSGIAMRRDMKTGKSCFLRAERRHPQGPRQSNPTGAGYPFSQAAESRSCMLRSRSSRGRRRQQGGASAVLSLLGGACRSCPHRIILHILLGNRSTPLETGETEIPSTLCRTLNLYPLKRGEGSSFAQAKQNCASVMAKLHQLYNPPVSGLCNPDVQAWPRHSVCRMHGLRLAVRDALASRGGPPSHRSKQHHHHHY